RTARLVFLSAHKLTTNDIKETASANTLTAGILSRVLSASRASLMLPMSSPLQSRNIYFLCYRAITLQPLAEIPAIARPLPQLRARSAVSVFPAFHGTPPRPA